MDTDGSAGEGLRMTHIHNWALDDAANLAAVLNNKKIHDNLRDALPFPYTVDDARSYIQFVLDIPKDSAYYWAIVCGNKVIGSIGLLRKDNVHRLTAELGYYIAEPHWGKGIATGAVREACAWAFANTDIARIFAEPFAQNVASCRVLEKAGFSFEDVMRNNAIKNGAVIDMRLYALLRENGKGGKGSAKCNGGD
ncbi:MAG: GNAT family N-acetyltransferase [Coriobacteriales bacterium]|jgi:RimJ/RimL family protein N-acetyltransferase|nr:GNAT family N-acetyltransferase [Coriobacteriales bacterium]